MHTRLILKFEQDKLLYEIIDKSVGILDNVLIILEWKVKYG